MYVAGVFKEGGDAKAGGSNKKTSQRQPDRCLSLSKSIKTNTK